MNIFLEETTNPLTIKRKLKLYVMILVLVPSFAYLYGIGERMNERYSAIERINSQPIDIALPKELPTNIYDF
jgi:hypothetical protein